MRKIVNFSKIDPNKIIIKMEITINQIIIAVKLIAIKEIGITIIKIEIIINQ